ncbi:MAG: cytochrome c biogenesis protein ResB, partial [Cyclobacteriaceae bacterium]|nr:cytochrome c biogenesis protein ResB [Cyclobacteriaceae bacterium]
MIIIIIGAALTRYIGFEGQMHIRQGQTTNRYLSTDTYFNVQVDDGKEKTNVSKRIWLSPVREKLYNETIGVSNSEFNVSIERYIPNAVEALVSDANGVAMLSLVSAGMQGRKDINLKFGESTTLNGLGVSFGDTTKQGNLQFIIMNGALFMKSPVEITGNSMAGGSKVNTPLSVGEFLPVASRQVFKFSNMNLMIKDFAEKASFSYVPSSNENQQVVRVAKVKIENEAINTEIFVKWGKWEKLNLNGINLSFKLGNQTWVLPFNLRLNEFQLDRYPGSMSPSSFASEITLIDEENNVEKPYRIFMNNILEYKGYRFYQSSYDNDEKGTVLSVNHDYWGTMVT